MISTRTALHVDTVQMGKSVHILNTSLKTWFTAMKWWDVWGHIAWGTGTSNLPARLPVGSRRSTLGHWASLRENVC